MSLLREDDSAMTRARKRAIDRMSGQGDAAEVVNGVIAAARILPGRITLTNCTDDDLLAEAMRRGLRLMRRAPRG